jgi:hypothetical protein
MPHSIRHDHVVQVGGRLSGAGLTRTVSLVHDGAERVPERVKVAPRPPIVDQEQQQHRAPLR